MDQQAHIERIERGAVAGVTQAVLREPIEDLERALVLDMVIAWRSNVLTTEKAYGLIGGISALHRLMTTLDSTQRQGEVSAEMEFGNVPGTE